MKRDHTNTPRDSCKSADYYEAFVTREREGIRDYTSYNNPALFFSVAPKCVRVARSLYSAGVSVVECLQWCGEAATYQRRFLAEGKQFKLVSPGNIDDYLELYSAAFLSNQSDDLIAALKKCEYTGQIIPGTMRLLEQFCDLLQGREVQIDQGQSTELESIKKDWVCLPVLFSTVSRKDISAAAPALDDYLANSWGPPIEKWAKNAIKSSKAEYCGKWSMFSAAACKILGSVPELSKKASAYVPADLVLR